MWRHYDETYVYVPLVHVYVGTYIHVDKIISKKRLEIQNTRRN